MLGLELTKEFSSMLLHALTMEGARGAISSYAYGAYGHPSAYSQERRIGRQQLCQSVVAEPLGISQDTSVHFCQQGILLYTKWNLIIIPWYTFIGAREVRLYRVSFY